MLAPSFHQGEFAKPFMNCRYCGRKLRMKGIRCSACRRYVLGWPHIIILCVLGAVFALGLLELLFRLI